MKKRLLPLIAMQILLILVMSGFAKQKVLVIVNNGFYRGYYADLVNNYANDIINLEYKNVEVIPWIIDEGTNVQQCTAVLQRLQNEYVEARNEGDVLEGAVLIGDIPVPQYSGGYGYMPLDQVYMDVVDGSGNRYEPPIAPDYTPFLISGSYYAGITPPPLEFLQYDQAIGDEHYDIWISRINAVYMHGIREGMTVYDEHITYVAYLDRVKARMNEPASVPSRGFYMGKPADHPIGFYTGFGQYLNELHLPWLAEFTTGQHHSSFNWLSQLLAGPRGCITYGAFNGSLFPTTGRNVRICRYDQLPNVYVHANGITTQHFNLQIDDPTDSLGWEWAGLYNHSCPIHSNFFSNDGILNSAPNLYIKLNGEFEFGTVGQHWGPNYRMFDGGNDGSYYIYQDYPSDPNPYQYGRGWKNKGAEWRWVVPAGGGGDYDVYLYYEENTANCNEVGVSLRVATRDANDMPNAIIDGYNGTVDQQTHINHHPFNYKWERLFGTTINNLQAGQMVIVSLSLNDEWSLRPGNRIVDAVRFIRTSGSGGGIDEVVDDNQPSTYPEVTNNPGTIFSTPGFRSSDDVFRGFEDMGTEPGGGGFSKTQFFLTNACSINDFIYIGGSTLNKNVGNLYALGYNGLICMGTSTTDYQGNNKGLFTIPLRNGTCFGQAYLDKMNSDFLSTTLHVLLGAGTLRAQPYVQYGSIIISNQVINSGWTQTESNPILIRNVTVNGNGSWDLTSYHNSWSPFGTHAEIIVRPETIFSPTGTNEVRLQALNQ